MKTFDNYGKTCTAYNDNDLESFNEIINQATSMWKAECKKDFDKHGDRGTCVMGAGIAVYYIPPKCRKPRRHTIINAGMVASCQGSVNWENSKDKIMEYLASNGLETVYEWGRMD